MLYNNTMFIIVNKRFIKLLKLNHDWYLILGTTQLVWIIIDI